MMAGNDSSEDFQQNEAIVIDPGSGSIKAGFSGDEKPRAVVRSSVGTHCQKGSQAKGRDQTGCLHGSNMLNEDSENMTIKKPITNGIITDWESLEKLWSRVFDEELQVCPKEHGILVTEPAFSPVSNREKMAEVIFEQFEAPAIYVSHQPVMSMYSYGLVSGLVVDSGAGCTSISPVYSGYCLPHATCRMDLAGRAVTDYLRKLMADAGFGFAVQRKSFAREMKKQSCYVSQDFKRELRAEKRGQLMEYQLPDGSTVTLGNERFRCPEILFCPSMVGASQPGVHILAMNSLQQCAPEWREALMANVVVCGGTPLLSGFTGRLQAEMEKLAPRDSKIRVLSGSHCEFSSWVGGSIITCLSSFQPMWVKRQDYLEEGAGVVRKKCY